MENKKVSLDSINEYWLEKNISKKESRFYLFIKRIIDVVLGGIGFIFFIILFPLAALAIKLDSRGNIIYKQERVGKNRKIFTLYKFRTMKEHENQHKEPWREINKDNITRVGKILRRAHLDELPQAINILKGNISFVGPRAEWIELARIFDKEIKFYKYRYLVKPGLIGWAQINFPPSKSVNEAKEKFEYDLYYIKNRSLLLDLEIILKSPKLFAW